MCRFSAWESGLIHIHALPYRFLPVLLTLLIHWICYYLVFASSGVLTLKFFFSSMYPHRIWHSAGQSSAFSTVLSLFKLN